MGDVIDLRPKESPALAPRRQFGLRAVGILSPALTPDIAAGLEACKQAEARGLERVKAAAKAARDAFDKRAVCVAELHIDYAAKVEMLAGLARDLAGEGAGLAEYETAAWLRDVQSAGETFAALVRARFHEEKP